MVESDDNRWPENALSNEDYQAWLAHQRGEDDDTSSTDDRDYSCWKDGVVAGGEPSKKTSCFIATAVYGDINAPQVQALRNFRDDVLAETLLGRAFIDFYYSGLGERVANLVKNRMPYTIPTIRRGLDFIVSTQKIRGRSYPI